MALRAVPDHPKFAHLKALLDQPKGATLGWLEAIWHFAGRFTPQGNVGKYSDQAIEAWVEWNGVPGALISALAESKWLDKDQEHRLIAHDWHEHADVMVHTTLARSLQRFANGAYPESGRLNARERERFNAWLESNGIAPKPSGRPAKRQPEVSRDADSLHDMTAEIPKPEPAPVPAPAPEPAPVLKASASASPSRVEAALKLVPPKVAKHVSAVDPRFTPFRDEIARYWELTNPNVPMPWDGSEAKRLNEWLKACPTLTLANLQTMLDNRSRSDIVQSHRPRTWIQSLTDYANGPVDRYGKPINARPSEASAGSMRSRDKLEAIYPGAVEAVFAEKPTCSVLQRALNVGYWEAVHLLDLMETRGLISAPGADGARTLLDRPAWLRTEEVKC